MIKLLSLEWSYNHDNQSPGVLGRPNCANESSAGGFRKRQDCQERQFVQVFIFLEISCFIPDPVFIRFGKFIRIHFNQFGKVSGADMEVEMKKMFTQNFEMKRMFTQNKFYSLNCLAGLLAGEVTDNLPSSKRALLPHFLQHDVRNKIFMIYNRYFILFKFALEGLTQCLL